jgi:PPK2 family polyphosphate:nucleotide phosphotransferase
MFSRKIIERLRVEPGTKVRLKNYGTGWAQTGELVEAGKARVKARAAQRLTENLARLAERQELLYADNRHAVLVVLQAMDAAGKDGTIKHVMSGLNPQGCQVFAFKQPSREDTDHNFLWRYLRCLPERGRIGIFNRSYYEDVLVTRVHPELLDQAQLPPGTRGKSFWENRFEDINGFERHLVRNGTLILKFFLHISKEEQKARFLERLSRSDKQWKFSLADLHERGYWDDYQDAYEKAISATSTDWAPWYIVPADQKWATRAVVADIIARAMSKLDLRYPEFNESERDALTTARLALEAE